MVTLKESEKRKNHSKRVKITPKVSKNNSKKKVIFPKEWKSLQKGEFHFLGSPQRDSSFVSSQRLSWLFFFFLIFVLPHKGANQCELKWVQDECLLLSLMVSVDNLNSELLFWKLSFSQVCDVCFCCCFSFFFFFVLISNLYPYF